MQIILDTTTEEMTVEGIRAYKLVELEKIEDLNRLTIKKRKSDYIPIEFENNQAKSKCKRGEQKNPYSIRYIRRKDLEEFRKSKKD